MIHIFCCKLVICNRKHKANASCGKAGALQMAREQDLEQMFDERQSGIRSYCLRMMKCLMRSAAGSDVDDVTPLGILGELWVTAEKMRRRETECGWRCGFVYTLWSMHSSPHQGHLSWVDASCFRGGNPCCTFLVVVVGGGWMLGDHWSWMQFEAGMAVRKAALLPGVFFFFLSLGFLIQRGWMLDLHLIKCKHTHSVFHNVTNTAIPNKS